jgi:hypothetical protein
MSLPQVAPQRPLTLSHRASSQVHACGVAISTRGRRIRRNVASSRREPGARVGHRWRSRCWPWRDDCGTRLWSEFHRPNELRAHVVLRSSRHRSSNLAMVEPVASDVLNLCRRSGFRGVLRRAVLGRCDVANISGGRPLVERTRWLRRRAAMTAVCRCAAQPGVAGGRTRRSLRSLSRSPLNASIVLRTEGERGALRSVNQ